jgi:uncharacterized protein
MKHWHEIRDPIHVFVRLSSDERKVLDSRPFQRLRQIHQLALSYLVYPGATHRRFEHSLGVMELAGRVFDVVTREDRLSDRVRSALPELSDVRSREYWRCALRMAALCHDIGHLPFSHAAEKELLPAGRTHEDLTALLIRGDELAPIWKQIKLDPEDVVKLALGPKKATGASFTTWETILSEIVVGDAFGVDRMDYLLRDSLHTGVAYGRFDHFRLIDTLRILPSPPQGDDGESAELALGIEEGGIQSAEALLLARYFMYSQVYFHPVRRIYDTHLKDFMLEWLSPDGYPVGAQGHLAVTDAEVTVAMRLAERNAEAPGHAAACCILRREHFKPLYLRNPADLEINPEAGAAVFAALQQQFGQEGFRHDRYTEKAGRPNFPVLMRDERVASSLSVSAVLNKLPLVSIDTVYAKRALWAHADAWLRTNRAAVLRPAYEEE